MNASANGRVADFSLMDPATQSDPFEFYAALLAEGGNGW